MTCRRNRRAEHKARSWRGGAAEQALNKLTRKMMSNWDTWRNHEVKISNLTRFRHRLFLYRMGLDNPRFF